MFVALGSFPARGEASKVRWETYEADQHAVVTVGLELILGKRASETLIDSMWALTSPEVFTKLTKERNWPVDRHERWLVQTAATLLAGAEP
jgi:hypothetical protein